MREDIKKNLIEPKDENGQRAACRKAEEELVKKASVEIPEVID